MAAIRRLDHWLGVCAQVFHALANACLAILLVINVINIASRAVFDKAIPWVFPWSVVLFVWMTFLGFFVLYRLRRDITIDFLVDRIGEGARMGSRLLVNAIVMLLMLVMLWHAPEVLAAQEGVIEMVFLFGVNLERYVMSTPLFVACGLIFLNYLVDTVYTFAGEPEPTKSHHH